MWCEYFSRQIIVDFFVGGHHHRDHYDCIWLVGAAYKNILHVSDGYRGKRICQVGVNGAIPRIGKICMKKGVKLMCRTCLLREDRVTNIKTRVSNGFAVASH